MSRTTSIVVIIVIIILIIAAAAALTRLKKSPTSPTTTTGTTGTSTTSTVSQITTTTTQTLTSVASIPNVTCTDSAGAGFACSQLEAQVDTWKSATLSPMGFSATLYSASYDGILTGNFQSEQQDLSMLLSSGVSCIRIDIGYDAWLDNNVTAQNDMTSLVNQIKSAGKCLIVADSSAENYRNNPLPWAQFKEVWAQRVKVLANLYQPTYYEVVKESTWYYPMIANYKSTPEVFNANDWNNLSNWLTNEVHSVSPQTKTGMAQAASDLQFSNIVNYMYEANTNSSLSFIGLDVYGQSDLNYTIQYVTSNHISKPTWIAEFWTTVNPPPNTPEQIQLDTYAMVAMFYMCEYYHISNFIPFFTDSFASYSSTVDYSQRTSVFQEFQFLASNFGAPLS